VCNVQMTMRVAFWTYSEFIAYALQPFVQPYAVYALHRARYRNVRRDQVNVRTDVCASSKNAKNGEVSKNHEIFENRYILKFWIWMMDNTGQIFYKLLMSGTVNDM
jgi:hypothetical protein